MHLLLSLDFAKIPSKINLPIFFVFPEVTGLIPPRWTVQENNVFSDPDFHAKNALCVMPHMP